MNFTNQSRKRSRTSMNSFVVRKTCKEEEEEEEKEVKVVDNNIYFYADVDKDTCFKLILALQKLDKEIQTRIKKDKKENKEENKKKLEAVTERAEEKEQYLEEKSQLEVIIKTLSQDETNKDSIKHLNEKLESVVESLLENEEAETEAVEEALELENKNTIHLHISSDGGDVFQGFNVIGKILAMKTPVYSYINGAAASAATMISVVCKKRFIYRYSHMLIHQLSGMFYGKFAEMNDDWDNCNILMKNIYKIYMENTNGKMELKTLKEYLRHDLWWDHDECLKQGLVDEIL